MVGVWWFVGGGWVLDFTRLMLISTQVEVVVELGKNKDSVKVESLTRKRSNKRLKKRKPYLPA